MYGDWSCHSRNLQRMVLLYNKSCMICLVIICCVVIFVNPSLYCMIYSHSRYQLLLIHFFPYFSVCISTLKYATVTEKFENYTWGLTQLWAEEQLLHPRNWLLSTITALVVWLLIVKRLNRQVDWFYSTT